MPFDFTWMEIMENIYCYNNANRYKLLVSIDASGRVGVRRLRKLL